MTRKVLGPGSSIGTQAHCQPGFNALHDAQGPGTSIAGDIMPEAEYGFNALHDAQGPGTATTVQSSSPIRCFNALHDAQGPGTAHEAAYAKARSDCFNALHDAQGPGTLQGGQGRGPRRVVSMRSMTRKVLGHRNRRRGGLPGRQVSMRSMTRKVLGRDGADGAPRGQSGFQFQCAP